MIPKQIEDLGFVKLKKQEKIPVESNWQNNPVSLDQIKKWINSGNNYGVLCGYKDLLVIAVSYTHLTLPTTPYV